MMRRAAVLSILLAPALVACKEKGSTSPNVHLAPRTFRMGFSALGPDTTLNSALATLNAWTPRADAAIMHLSVPYRALLTGTTAALYVSTVEVPLANFYRGKGLTIVVTVDVTNGLDRSAEDPDLVAMHRSITEPAVQQVYRQFVQQMVAQIHPDYLGLAAEVNLIRAAAPAAVYAAVVQMTNAAVADLGAGGGTLPRLYASIQGDVAWGHLLPGPGTYIGVAQDFTDFPFMQAIAISSYPYFVYPDPDNVPLDYYARLGSGRALPVLVVEGGWTSGAVGSVQSSPATQARYLRRQERILDSAKAVAVFQLSYTDLDVSSYPQPPGSILPLFAQLGVVDAQLHGKPALATYDSIFARPLAK